MHLETETFDHHKPGKDNENLTPRAGHELQGVVEPIALFEHEFLGLRIGRFKLRIGQHGGQRDKRGKSACGEIDRVVAQIKGLPARHDEPVGDQGRR